MNIVLHPGTWPNTKYVSECWMKRAMAVDTLYCHAMYLASLLKSKMDLNKRKTMWSVTLLSLLDFFFFFYWRYFGTSKQKWLLNSLHCISFSFLLLCMLVQCHGLLEYLNNTKISVNIVCSIAFPAGWIKMAVWQKVQLNHESNPRNWTHFRVSRFSPSCG